MEPVDQTSRKLAISERARWQVVLRDDVIIRAAVEVIDDLHELLWFVWHKTQSVDAAR